MSLLYPTHLENLLYEEASWEGNGKRIKVWWKSDVCEEFGDTKWRGNVMMLMMLTILTATMLLMLMMLTATIWRQPRQKLNFSSRTKRALPRQRNSVIPTKNGAVASGNDFSIVCIRQINNAIDDSDIQISTRSFLFLKCNPSCGRGNHSADHCKALWRAIHSGGTPLSGLVWIDAGAFCVAGVAFRDIDGAFVWQARH